MLTPVARSCVQHDVLTPNQKAQDRHMSDGSVPWGVMAAARSASAWIAVIVALVAPSGAGVWLAVPIGVKGDSNCGWAWQAIGRRDTPVCDGPGWTRISQAFLLVVIGVALLAVIARHRRTGAST